jgi:hypothetical protein
LATIRDTAAASALNGGTASGQAGGLGNTDNDTLEGGVGGVTDESMDWGQADASMLWYLAYSQALTAGQTTPDNAAGGDDTPGDGHTPDGDDTGEGGGSSRDAEIGLGTLDGANGFHVVDGVGLNSGTTVAMADVNGDGYADLIVGTWGASPNAPVPLSGGAYVIFGKAEGFDAEINVNSLNGTNGFRLSGSGYFEGVGQSVSAADLNGDGFADLIIGASGADHHGRASGATYVVFGASSFDSHMELSALNGANGFALLGEAPSAELGVSVSAAGDINGDGFADVILGSTPGVNDMFVTGQSFVIFGAASGFDANIDVSSLDGTNGFRISGVDWDYAGFSVSGAGDVNGDGLADLIIGGRAYDGASTAHIVFGSTSGFGANFELSSLNGANGFRLFTPGAGYGVYSSTAGDVNGDGYSDVLVGSGVPNGGMVPKLHLVYGKAGGFSAEVDAMEFDGGFGWTKSAGDVNGDGLDDFIIGSSLEDAAAPGAGAVYVVFGHADGYAPGFGLSSIDGTNGFKLTGVSSHERAGTTVNAAGDINGDGFADIAIGVFRGEGSGESYVYFGHDFNGAVTHAGTSGADTLVGTGGADVIVGGQGDDAMSGNGGADVFRGGAGNDRIKIAASDFSDLDGGTGGDTLALGGTGFELDLTRIADSKITGIEAIDLGSGYGDHALKLSLRDLLNLSDTGNTLTVKGDADDSVEIATGVWTDAGVRGDYHVYTLGDATLKVNTDITSVDIALA